MIDYYEQADPGCCLVCPDAYPGCLCYNCKCSKCVHYSGNDPDADIKNEETGGEICLLVLHWQHQKKQGQLKSEFKIHERINQTDKAVQCVLINKRTGGVSDKLFWVPISVVKDGYVQKWFADKEIRSEFKKDVKPQRKLV